MTKIMELGGKKYSVILFQLFKKVKKISTHLQQMETI